MPKQASSESQPSVGRRPAPPPASPHQTDLRIGTAGWSIPRAAAADFPGPGSHLERFARVFSGCEINATFYRSPRPATYERWAAAVPESFRFALKAPRAITHEALLQCTTLAISAFLNEARQLGPRLGPLLFQLPPKLAFDHARAETFFRALRDLHPGAVVLEPRHSSWFEPPADLLLNTLRIARAAADPPRIPAGMQPGGHPGLFYFRLHGSPRTYYSSYGPDFIALLAAEIAKHQDSGTAEIWCIFDNTASGAAAPNALSLLDHLRRIREPTWEPKPPAGKLR